MMFGRLPVRSSACVIVDANEQASTQGKIGRRGFLIVDESLGRLVGLVKERVDLRVACIACAKP